MAEQDNPAIAPPTESKKETKDIQKRKREDDADDEGEAIHPPSGKRRRLRAPLGEETEPSPLPIPCSSHDLYMKVNLENSPLPKYKKQKLQDLVKKIKFKSFLRDTDKLRRDAKVLPLTRFEMEAAWYQLVYRRWESKGVGVENSATETEKQRLKQNYLQMALDQVCTGGSPSNLTLLTFDGF